jgi:hypothetical protein
MEKVHHENNQFTGICHNVPFRPTGTRFGKEVSFFVPGDHNSGHFLGTPYFYNVSYLVVYAWLIKGNIDSVGG